MIQSFKINKILQHKCTLIYANFKISWSGDPKWNSDFYKRLHLYYKFIKFSHRRSWGEKMLTLEMSRDCKTKGKGNFTQILYYTW